MKYVFYFLFLSISCYGQESRINYIISNNYASEAEFYFFEEYYDSAAYYYEKAFEFVSEPHPMQQYNYAKALWKIEKYELSIEKLVQTGMRTIDTNWFVGLTPEKHEYIDSEIRWLSSQKDSSKNCSFYNAFMDSILDVDQLQRQQVMQRLDSLRLLKPYPEQLIDSLEPIWWGTVSFQDSCNGQAIIQFAHKYGFPAGVNTCWNQTASTILLHMSPEWFVRNYAFLYSEVVQGNLEPWMLARGIDRMFTIEVGDEKINPYNRYWDKSAINPFLMFNNCVSLGVSPYYDYNWFIKPRKTINFDYYKDNKRYFNTAFGNIRH